MIMLVIAIAIAIALALGAFQAFRVYIDADEPSRAVSPGVAVAAPVAKRAGRGFVVSMGVRFRRCDEPLEVTLVVTGTEAFWRDRQLRRETRVVISLPAARVSGLSAGLGRDPTDGLLRPLDEAPASAAPLRGWSHELRSGVYNVSLAIASWHRHLRPAVVRFHAEWLQPRTAGTCFLQLPALSGPLTVLSAQVGRRQNVDSSRPYRTGREVVRLGPLQAEDAPRLEPDVALMYLETGPHSIDAARTLPAPDEGRESAYRWTCKGRGEPRGESILHEKGPKPPPADILYTEAGTGLGVYSNRRYERLARSLDCRSLVVLVEEGAESRRDLALLLIGAAISLAATLMATTSRLVAGRRAR
jgi:hypothetical protein